ncbi:type 1 glutamine amidotransferase [Rhodococcus sp. BP-349]|uniref:type 1 glutamine amidotransferase n=1 Tax=unclassified Rhodococcus (in: high G+C Gram-positive bacteria) TaxID=192944 RepID=UPI001C9ADA29|nr:MULTISPECIES: type 1 glutamine amidotransferase [unclassified Rhodococcus (in: high G+C Gram-positive bacteria)]MBY6539544.1 type 1 glutamine amidotransferase [Rhodococcus sp. BP-363]MBY6544128.1 type 1 glutamine amidotransferase [Rhodococcus sp. BP-369]MBY6563358.1 type 1 glutamine amidotransferase [Rhodococcus sp. BP-370]MBY6577650.1 type 1 glutamine amidotransferase [Rhodococcus sp. BP-364]MBY6586951.1 type 1 glutamine amidotransferase [Rhodococcus sp. BP-358]
MTRAALVFHERDHALGVRNVGSIGPALRDRGFETTTFSFEGDSRDADRPAASSFDLIVLMGSPDAAYDDALPWLAEEITWLGDAVAQRIPVLGVCFGGQLLARVLGGTVTRAAESEHGFVTVRTESDELIPQGPWMQFHDDTFTLPPGAEPLATSAAALQAFVSGPHIGLQFHPEITVDVFESWIEGWDARGVRAEVEADVDVPAIRAEVARREQASVEACSRLIDAVLARAGVSR